MVGYQFTPAVSAEIHVHPVRNPPGEDPNAVCAGCHREIYNRYRKTPMANASGAATSGFIAADFTHAPSGVSYRIEEESGQVYLDYERRAAAVNGQELKGRRELKYFLGSGTRGRTYLFEQDGYWFEIPINWYAKKKIWDMAPGYLQAEQMPLTLPVDPGCLRCHASGAKPSLTQARNRYAGEPFAHGGITCTACHGEAAEHVSSSGKVALAKINELPSVRRDSICLNCHLEGQVAVVHKGKRLVDFRPGDNIFEYISYFVRKAKPGMASLDRRATSQWEALLESGCKRGSGSKLTCTSCHDPHGSTVAMTAQERVSYYRGKCLACHASETAAGRIKQGSFGLAHHPENPDCTNCHMPRAPANDIAHEQVTDHRIPKTVKAVSKGYAAPLNGDLIAVENGLDGLETGTDGLELKRDLGLAYAQIAARGDVVAGERAIKLLREAETKPGSAADVELHGQLGFLEQLGGDGDAAARQYGMALEADSDDAFAAGNLALIQAKKKEYTAAAVLWEKAFRNDPVQLQAGMNLAIVDCGLGRREAAISILERMLEFSPDNSKAKAMLFDVRSKRRPCMTR